MFCGLGDSRLAVRIFLLAGKTGAIREHISNLQTSRITHFPHLNTQLHLLSALWTDHCSSDKGSRRSLEPLLIKLYSICFCPHLMPTISEAVSTSLTCSLVFVFQLLLKCFRSFLPPMRTISSETKEGVNFIKDIRRWWRTKKELWYTQSADIWGKITDVFI